MQSINTNIQPPEVVLKKVVEDEDILNLLSAIKEGKSRGGTVHTIAGLPQPGEIYRPQPQDVEYKITEADAKGRIRMQLVDKSKPVVAAGEMMIVNTLRFTVKYSDKKGNVRCELMGKE